MLKTITTIDPTLSKLPLAPLKITDTFSFSSTNKNPFQTKTNFIDTANPCQTLYQPHTAAIRGPYATLPSSSFTVNPIEPSAVSTQNYTVYFAAMNKSVRTFDGLDHQNTPEECLHPIDAHMIFTMGEPPLDDVGSNQWHKQKTS